jgi:hypothetical protein
MISNWLAATLSRRNIHYGWVMVGVTFLAALISAGTVGAPGVFIVPLQKEFGWSNAEISSALSIRFILFGLMAPFAAALLNRYGLRKRHAGRTACRRIGPRRIAVHDTSLAADAAVGRRHRRRHRHDRACAGRHHRHPLVRRKARARGRHPHCECCDRAIAVSCQALAAITEQLGWRVALGLVCMMLGVRRLCGAACDARPSKRRGLASLRR